MFRFSTLNDLNLINHVLRYSGRKGLWLLLFQLTRGRWYLRPFSSIWFKSLRSRCTDSELIMMQQTFGIFQMQKKTLGQKKIGKIYFSSSGLGSWIPGKSDASFAFSTRKQKIGKNTQKGENWNLMFGADLTQISFTFKPTPSTCNLALYKSLSIKAWWCPSSLVKNQGTKAEVHI